MEQQQQVQQTPRTKHLQQFKLSQPPLNSITNTINSRPSLLRKPGTNSNTIDNRLSYPPPSDSKFIQQQPLLTNSVINIDFDNNSNNNINNNYNNNHTLGGKSNVSLQISQLNNNTLNSSQNSKAYLNQKKNYPTTNTRPTVKKKLDDIHKPIASNIFKKPLPINNNNSNSNSRNIIVNKTTTTTVSPPPPSSSSSNIVSPISSLSSSSLIISPTSSASSISSKSQNFEKSNLFSRLATTNKNMYSNINSINQFNSTSNNDNKTLQERMGKIDSFTASFRGELQNQFVSIQDSLKPPRLSLSINDIKTRLDYEEKNKELERIKSEMKNLNNVYKEKEKEMMEAQYKVIQLQVKNEQLTKDLECSNGVCADLQHEIRSNSLMQIEIDQKFHCMSSNTKEKDDEIQRLTELLAEKDSIINQLKSDKLELQEKSARDEKIRKQLHNTIQELKGNIRVFCRIRPDFSTVDGNGAVFHLPAGTDNSIDVSTPSTNSFNNEQSIKKVNYTFDRVFGPSSTQEIVFEDISQLVQSSLDGYNCCIFTYGQTGSGKTHLMIGDLSNPIQRGMIPRTVEKIFNSASELELKGWKYQMDCFFLEIYNETINDLLNPNRAVADQLKYEIKHNLDTNITTVTNLTTVQVNSPSKVYELLTLANKTRSVAKTLCNERSSRSHTVFQLKLTGVNVQSGERTQGLLNLIDLAGSERVSKSGVTGDRLKETQAINKSLSSLSDVISSLANKEQHIPYRNSKLTYLLQNSIGGNSKTLMFVNISPELKDLQESTSSLRFAAKVNSCEIGVAKKQQSKIDLKQQQQQ